MAYQQRWFYASSNLGVSASIDNLIALVNRAAKCGYNGMVLADYKFAILDLQPASYFVNVERLKQAASAAGIEIIPFVFPLGDAGGLVSHDKNQAEGLPVIGAPFVVRGGVATLVPDPDVAIKNGGLEWSSNNAFDSWGTLQHPGQSSFTDRSVVHTGTQSCRMENVRAADPANGMCRLVQNTPVKPHRCYRLSCWVKTSGLSPAGSFHMNAFAVSNGLCLTYPQFGANATQDWTRASSVFNSLGETSVNVYVGLWGNNVGTLWIDDIAIEEVSLTNILRRPGCPLTVTGADGTVYAEGTDYAPVRDPLLGGSVPGETHYDWDHAGPVLTIPAGSRIAEGQRLSVSWYHPLTVLGRVVACLSEPEFDDILHDQAKRVNDLFHPKTFFMGHDEIRITGWCQACHFLGKTPGHVLADNVTMCCTIIKNVNRDARIVVWSDMFDPYANATEGYYLSNGTLAGAAKGLPDDLVVCDWNQSLPTASLDWFSRLGQPQVMAVYYDAGDAAKNMSTWQAAARGVPRVTGWMYTTWRNDYSQMENYAAGL